MYRSHDVVSGFFKVFFMKKNRESGRCFYNVNKLDLCVAYPRSFSNTKRDGPGPSLLVFYERVSA